MNPPKPPARRQRKTTRTVGNLAVLPRMAGDSRPRAPKGLRAEQRGEWRAFWAGELAALVRPDDMPALRRLFVYRSQLATALEAFAAEPVTVGSTGQPRRSPWFDMAAALEKDVSALEARFGLDPQARLRLGIQVQEGVSLAARNAAFLSRMRGV